MSDHAAEEVATIQLLPHGAARLASHHVTCVEGDLLGGGCMRVAVEGCRGERLGGRQRGGGVQLWVHQHMQAKGDLALSILQCPFAPRAAAAHVVTRVTVTRNAAGGPLGAIPAVRRVTAGSHPVQ